MKFVQSDSNNVFFNLAIEEYLTEEVHGEGIIVYLWRNEKAIVIGRNQNPYAECNLEYAEENGILVARRNSGGGAVYHDLGNVNYTVIYENGLLDRKDILDYVIKVISSLGVNANASGRNDIEVNRKKVAGTAYYEGKDYSYQHGCILVDVDIETMNKVLNPMQDKIQSKGVKSVRSRVSNLANLHSGINTQRLEEAFEIYLKYLKRDISVLKRQRIEPEKITDDRYKYILEKYLSWEWNIGKKIDMSYVIHDRFIWGDCTMIFDTNCNEIRRVFFYSDSLNISVFSELSKSLAGIPFRKEAILNQLDEVIDNTLKKQDKEIIFCIKNMIIRERSLYG